jgi:hypothetical protein
MTETHALCLAVKRTMETELQQDHLCLRSSGVQDTTEIGLRRQRWLLSLSDRLDKNRRESSPHHVGACKSSVAHEH